MNNRLPSLLLAAAAAFARIAQAQAPDPGVSLGPGYVNVRHAPYSAAGDGKTDDTQAIQRALDDVAVAGGGIAFVPTGSYLIAGHLRVPGGVALTGAGRAPQAYAPKQPASTLLAVEGAGNADGVPFLTLLGPNSALEGITVFYPKQVIENPPVPYPWTVRGGGGGDSVSIINVLLVNPYQAVDFGTNRTQRHYVRGLYGQPLLKGIWVDQCYDIGRIKDVHFWPFWTQDKRIVAFTTTRATTFIFQRTDWEIVDDIFCWGYKTGVELSASRHGAMNGQMANINLDNVDIGFDVSDTQPYAVHVSNLNIANAGAGSRHIAILGHAGAKTAELSVRGASFWGSLNQAVSWDAPGLFSLSDSRILRWSPQLAAIEITKGRAMIHDNSFRDKVGTAIRIGPAADRVILHDNQLNDNRIVNEAGPLVLISNNQP
jgi:hypothetical protein